MSYKIVLLALVALQALATTALPPCVCTRNLQPVCGSDGKTYANSCLLECEKHKTGVEVTLAKQGSCEGETSCVCTYKYKPVCGTDGYTYPNECVLKCKRFGMPEVEVASTGPCPEPTVTEPPCICTDNLDYVCGSDGNTYANPCLLNCATAKNHLLSVKHQGQCVDKVRVAELPQNCICTLELNEVCGSDGKTYSNPCLLNCAKATKSTLDIKHQGGCLEVKVAELPQPAAQPICICTMELNEVCGSDGNTYANPCLLNCATAKNHLLSVKHQGQCVDKVRVAELPQNCICTLELNEVCGSDGKTYSNPCLLNCAAGTNPSLGLRSYGACNSVNVVNPILGDQPNCTCPRNRRPVCGSDGVTYNNECLLNCAGAQVSLARLGPC